MHHFGLKCLTLVLMCNLMFATLTESYSVFEEEYKFIDGVPYEIERSCAMVGGMCVAKTDCAELTTKKGLCPENEAKGYECCYAVKPRPSKCSSLQGECMDKCAAPLQRPEAIDCGSQVCCTLI